MPDKTRPKTQEETQEGPGCPPLAGEGFGSRSRTLPFSRGEGQASDTHAAALGDQCRGPREPPDVTAVELAQCDVWRAGSRLEDFVELVEDLWRPRGIHDTSLFLLGSFSAVSAPIFTTKYAFCSNFQNLQNYLAEFSKRFLFFAKNQRFLQKIGNCLQKSGK